MSISLACIGGRVGCAFCKIKLELLEYIYETGKGSRSPWKAQKQLHNDSWGHPRGWNPWKPKKDSLEGLADAEPLEIFDGVKEFLKVGFPGEAKPPGTLFENKNTGPIHQELEELCSKLIPRMGLRYFADHWSFFPPASRTFSQRLVTLIR